MEYGKEVSLMEKECREIRFTETDDGFRIDVTGESLKEWFSCCCVPMFGGIQKGTQDCCVPDEQEKK